MTLIRATLAGLCSASLLAMGMLMPAQAAMISNPQSQQANAEAVERAELVAALQRKDVQQQLVALGVDMEAAQERVNALSAEEIAQLNHAIADMPAGGVIEVVGVVFVVLLVLELLGVTNVFTSF